MNTLLYFSRFTLIFCLALGLLSCSNDHETTPKTQTIGLSAEAKLARELLAYSLESMNQFISGITAAETDDAIVIVIEKYNQSLLAMVEKSAGWESRLAKVNLESDPEYYKTLSEQHHDAVKRFMAAYQKVYSHLENPLVEAATDKMVKNNELVPKFTIY